MRNKSHKYKNMSAESLKFGNLKNINKNSNSESGIFIEIIMCFIYFFFLILSWAGFLELIKYQYIFTIYRYINYSFSIYFPIQLASFVLLLMFLFTEIIISLICIYFVMKLIMNILKKRKNKIFLRNPIKIIIPIVSNSILFLIGIFMKKKYENIKYYYTGLVIDIISLYVLLKINFDKKIKPNFFMINYGDNDFMKKIFEDFFLDILLAIDLYYCYYVIFQIIYLLSNYNIELLNFSGIVINFSMGLVSIYVNFNLKSIGFNIIYLIIYLGIFIFQFTIREEERNEYQIGYGEIILSFIFLIYFFIESIIIFCFNCDFD